MAKRIRVTSKTKSGENTFLGSDKRKKEMSIFVGSGYCKDCADCKDNADTYDYSITVRCSECKGYVILTCSNAKQYERTPKNQRKAVCHNCALALMKKEKILKIGITPEVLKEVIRKLEDEYSPSMGS